jgi:hypothetical protein
VLCSKCARMPRYLQGFYYCTCVHARRPVSGGNSRSTESWGGPVVGMPLGMMDRRRLQLGPRRIIHGKTVQSISETRIQAELWLSFQMGGRREAKPKQRPLSQQI